MYDMGFFNFKKKKDVLDLTETLNRREEKLNNMKEDMASGSNEEPQGEGIFSLFGNANPSQTSVQPESNLGEEENKRSRLAKRLVMMTDKLEDLSNQIYHLQQRVEVLEKKLGNRI